MSACLGLVVGSRLALAARAGDDTLRNGCAVENGLFVEQTAELCSHIVLPWRPADAHTDGSTTAEIASELAADAALLACLQEWLCYFERRVDVKADGGADAAGDGALLHHVLGVLVALVVHAPQRARRRVLVCARRPLAR